MRSIRLDERPIDPDCDCPVCRNFSRAYLRHLFVADEMLAMRLAVMHNLYFYNKLTERIREALDAGHLPPFRGRVFEKLAGAVGGFEDKLCNECGKHLSKPENRFIMTLLMTRSVKRINRRGLY